VLGAGEVPYGPFLAVASLGYLFFADSIRAYWPF
jgi:hypothetical protein